MKAIEFPIKLNKEKVINIPDRYKKSLSENQKVKVILLIQDEDEDWHELAVREFEKGYDEKDSIYDSI